MRCVRLALVNLYVKQAQSNPIKAGFFVPFYYLFKNRNPIYKLSTAVKRAEQNRTELNRTKLSLFPRAYSEIVVPFPFKLTYSCSKTTRRVTQSGIPASLLLHIWSLQSTAYLKLFLRNFFVHEKHVRYTPGSSISSFQDLVMDFQHKSRVRKWNARLAAATFLELKTIYHTLRASQQLPQWPRDISRDILSFKCHGYIAIISVGKALTRSCP